MDAAQRYEQLVHAEHTLEQQRLGFRSTDPNAHLYQELLGERQDVEAERLRAQLHAA